MVSASAVSLVGGALLAPGSAAAAPPTDCVQPDPSGPITCTYQTAGTHALLLPAGVRSVQVTAIGGRGGTVFYDGLLIPAGRGAVVSSTVPVPAGTRATLYAVVGGNGTDIRQNSDAKGGAGGSGGGGNGGGRNERIGVPGAGGGGASDVRTGVTDLTSRILVAAGGGGAGGNSYTAGGGDAGAVGGNEFQGGHTAGQESGKPGTGTSGGAGGTYFDRGRPELDGVAGSLGVGGSGGPIEPTPDFRGESGGGGGGGGLYGGGGGALYGGGGGGASLLPAAATFALTTAAPSITISYQLSATPHQPCAGLVCTGPDLFGSS